jgi:hypothetical protein
MVATGTRRVAVDTFGDNLFATLALNRLVQAHDDGRIGCDEGREQQSQQDATEGQTQPGGATEHAAIGLKLEFLAHPHRAQGRRDGACGRSQDGADQQDQRMLPG